MNFKEIQKLLVIGIIVLVIYSCKSPGGDSPGSEYMPDMAHSVAYEANYYNYYSFNTWGTEGEYYEMAQPRKPVPGTVSRTSAANIAIPTVGSVPYAYGDSEDERTRATNELIDNPFPITDKGIATGKELYDLYCGICHGAKGDGNGYLVRDDGGKYPAQPANFLLDEFVSASNGRYYHSIMHGKNVMGGYSDKLSYDERWQVIHYIRSLQAKDKKLAYNQLENTLNAIDKPAGENVMIGMNDGHLDNHEEAHHEGGHHDGDHTHEGHSHDGGGHHGHDTDGHGEDHKH